LTHSYGTGPAAGLHQEIAAVQFSETGTVLGPIPAWLEPAGVFGSAVRPSPGHDGTADQSDLEKGDREGMPGSVTTVKL
jgi:hypothetical protein